ncbi:SDR family oxidoreductase [Vibrio porteresiae]|uniref:SDR family oxidoreductase n=1 Tax=Vibrio porteresiae DSM 19223 TaxID=1123496 RepID=A0ABZ0QF16_9VIBR|nr:SDR family oxidoreductase [Vibrio porteresiae]WPC75069.1 SDR family oxidoreductase [Vibrio porteresiae DSM 19223]
MDKKVLLAGATGYLGSFVAAELLKRDYTVRTVVRDATKLDERGIVPHELLEAEVTESQTLIGCCEGIDTVISTVGITRQKDGLSYMDVDYQANLNLLEQAKASGVRKFIYVSILDGEKLRKVSLCKAKERFVEALKNSGLEYTVVRPNGFFSDMDEFYHMAETGRIFLFSGGQYKSNPIHGADLANLVVDAIDTPKREVAAGGPDVLTHRQIAEMAFKCAGKKPTIIYVPGWVGVLAMGASRFFTSRHQYGPIEFFMTVMSRDMLAPPKGQLHLEEHYRELHGHSASK